MHEGVYNFCLHRFYWNLLVQTITCQVFSLTLTVRGVSNKHCLLTFFILSSTHSALCIETKRNFVNQNKGKITLKIFPWAEWVLLWVDVWFISIENSGKQKSKNTLRAEINQFWNGKRDTMRSANAISKICGVELPHPFLESRGSVIRNNFLKYRTNKAAHFARRNNNYALLAINKATHILNMLFSCSFNAIIYS